MIRRQPERQAVVGHVVVEIDQTRVDQTAGVHPRGMVEPSGSGAPSPRHTLNDPGVVDVEHPVGNFRLRIVEGDEVTGDRKGGGQQRCGRVCYGEMLIGCVSRD
jgi:hypothetical protein